MSPNSRRHKLNKLLQLLSEGEASFDDFLNHLKEMGPEEVAACILRWYKQHLIHEALPKEDPIKKLEKRVLNLEESLTQVIKSDMDRRNSQIQI